MVRAKFVVRSKVETSEGAFEIALDPVVGGSPENDEFYKWTPAGQISLAVLNERAAASFEVGAEFYVDFNAVDSAA